MRTEVLARWRSVLFLIALLLAFIATPFLKEWPVAVLRAAPPSFVVGQVCSNTADAQADTITCVMPGNTTTGGLLVCGATRSDAPLTIVSMSDGTNNFAQAVVASHASGTNTAIWYVANITGLTTPTITVTFDSFIDAAFRRVVCAEYTGIVTTSALGVTDSNVSDTGTSITTNDGSPPATTAGNELLVVVGMSEGQTTTWTAGSGFTERVENTGDYHMVLADKVEATASTTVAGLLTMSTTDAATALVATFKAIDTGGGGGSTVRRLLTLGVGE